LLESAIEFGYRFQFLELYTYRQSVETWPNNLISVFDWDTSATVSITETDIKCPQVKGQKPSPRSLHYTEESGGHVLELRLKSAEM
jgi:hypothetical protein